MQAVQAEEITVHIIPQSSATLHQRTSQLPSALGALTTITERSHSNFGWTQQPNFASKGNVTKSDIEKCYTNFFQFILMWLR